jgi:hypothetical protein
MSDLACNIIDLEFVNAPGAAPAGEDIAPSGFNSATEGRYKAQPGYDDAA